MSNMVVRTNVMSINSHRNLGLVGNMQERASARLSSGFRINSAADDAAGLAISEKMRAQIRGLDQASRNGQDGISLIQTAEGAMSIVNDMVVRIRELVVQAANDTNAHDGGNLAQSDRIQIQREINNLMDEIDDITLRTEFNTRTLLDGSLGLSAALGNFAGTSAFAVDGLAHAFGSIGGIDIAIVDASGNFTSAATASGQVHMNAAIGALNMVVGDVMDLMTTLARAGVSLTAGVLEGLAGAADTARLDALNAAGAVSGGAGSAITADLLSGMAARLVSAGGGDAALNAFAGTGTGSATPEFFMTFNQDIDREIWFHIGANAAQGINLGIEAVNVSRLDDVGFNRTALTVSTETAQNTAAGFGFAALRNDNLVHNVGIMLTDGEEINRFIPAIDAALAHVQGQRAHLGAIENRLEFTIENLDIASENLNAAASRIRDADMAQEMMRFTQSNVLQQAAISMLAQANQAPQSILSLLR